MRLGHSSGGKKWSVENCGAIIFTCTVEDEISRKLVQRIVDIRFQLKVMAVLGFVNRSLTSIVGLAHWVTKLRSRLPSEQFLFPLFLQTYFVRGWSGICCGLATPKHNVLYNNNV